MLYEDRLLKARAAQDPAVKGHVRLLVEAESFSALSDDDFAHVLSAATFLSSVLFEQAGAHGTNVVFSDLGGVGADVVARDEGDNLDLRWQPASIPSEEMDAVAAKIKDRCDYIGVQRKPERKPEVTEPAGKDTSEEPSEEDGARVKSYLLRKLDRLP